MYGHIQVPICYTSHLLELGLISEQDREENLGDFLEFKDKLMIILNSIMSFRSHSSHTSLCCFNLWNLVFFILYVLPLLPVFLFICVSPQPLAGQGTQFTQYPALSFPSTSPFLKLWGFLNEAQSWLRVKGLKPERPRLLPTFPTPYLCAYSFFCLGAILIKTA